MKKYLILIIFSLFFPLITHAGVLADKLSGMILLSVEKKGEAWYVNPSNKNRYFLGRPADAFRIMRELGLGINEIEFQKIAQSGMPVAGDLELSKKLSGRILLQVEKNGEAWYVYPKDLKKYYLGRPDDAFRIMRELSLGISLEDLASIHKPGNEENIDKYSKYEHKKITTVDGIFTVDMVTIDLANPNLKIITETMSAATCEKNCTAKPLSKFVFANEGFTGINGTYFCTSADCEYNSYYFPVFNSNTGVLVNEEKLKYWTTGPLMAFDQNNKFYYFKDSRDFKSVADFEKTYGVKLQAAIGNKPRLIENFMNQLIDWEIDKKQKDTRASRNAIGYKDNTLYLVIAYNATVPHLANVMKALGVEYSLNLDGGYSSALIYNGEYMVGPGRNIPNAIVFTEKQ